MSTNSLAGYRFGRLMAIRPLRRRHTTTGAVRWACLCDCGNSVTVASTSLRSGHTRSCGCWHRDAAAKQINNNRPEHPRWKHGGTSDPRLIPTHRAFQAMLRRCYNPHARNYPFYGGAGVTVCDEWRNSFPAFLKDMGKKPNGTTLGRILDVGQYCRANCAWMTNQQQQQHRRLKRHFVKNVLSQALLIGPYGKSRQVIETGVLPKRSK